jgi:fucose 4-O-acetylase-like acetyltransferase
MNTISKSKSRNYLFDNVRAFLIFLVVFGHMITEQLGNTVLINALYYYIYIFHMPAFIFISGYFSKNTDKSRDNAISSYFIPYVMLNTGLWILGKFDLMDTSGPFRIFNPVWGMWFLLVVFVWKMLLKDLVRIPYILPFSFLFSLLSGFSEEFATKFALGRIISFLPFFLLGYFCKDTHIEKLKKYHKGITIIILGLGTMISYMGVHLDIKKENLYMRLPYSKMGNSSIEGVILRSIIYIIAILMIFSLINLFGTKQTWFSVIGQNSVTVYIFHLVAVSNLRKLELPWDETNYYIIYALIMSMGITLLCSRPFIFNIYNVVMKKINLMIFHK